MKPSLHLPCLRGKIGKWIYYSAVMTPAELSKHVMTSKEIRESKALEDYLQRDLKPRVKKIATYLKKRDHRFFNSVILGVFDALPNWVEMDLSAVGEKLEIPSIRTLEKTMGVLIFHGTEKMFAIDGQHRVEGIKEAFAEDSQRFSDDQYSVIFLAHVDDPPGKVRTRRLFCDINKNAVAVSEGDKVIIDEDDICAVTARRIYAEYPKFKKGSEIAVSERKEVLTQKDKKGVERERFTSLLAVFTVCKKLRPLFKKLKGIAVTAPENVNQYKTIATAFFDYIIKHEASLKRYFEGKTTLQKERKNNANLFFRPVGLEVLVRLYTHFNKVNRLNRLSIGLKKINFQGSGGIFENVLWSSGRIKAGAKEKTVAVDLCLYLLHELKKNEETGLLKEVREITQNPDYVLPKKISVD
jgi:DNA sulfur modification protein DndB